MPGAASALVAASFLAELADWFTDPATWSGNGGIPARTVQHIAISAAATGAASAIALPAAIALGHVKRGGSVAVAAVGVARAVPSFAVIVVALPVSVSLGLGIGFWPTLAALILLAVPVIFTNAFTGVAQVEPHVVEAARGMGFQPWRLVVAVELPLATPLIVAGLRIAAVQVVATATLGALVGWGGLGRFIVDGLAQQNDAEVFGGALIVAVLSLATLGAFGLLERMAVARPASGKARAR